MFSSFQLKLPEPEKNRLALRVSTDYEAASRDHMARMEKFRRHYQLFRNRVDPPAPGDENKSNYQVPVVQWNQFTEWARQSGALFGDDAQIIAKPVGPSDEQLVGKVALYTTWRMFNSMRMLNPLSIFLFRKILFGHSFAYRPWTVKSFDKLIPDKRYSSCHRVTPSTYYERPDFIPLWPDDLIVPAEDVDSLHELSFMIRRYPATPDQLLRGDGTLYQGIRQNFERIVNAGSSAK